MDWRFVDDEKWSDIYVALNGAGVESISAKWEELFGGEEVISATEKVKKPRKKAVAKTVAAKGKAAAKKSTAKAPAKKAVKATKKTATVRKVSVTKKTAVKKPKATAKKTSAKKPVAKKVSITKTSKKR
jgi:hypothetical protein